MIYAGCGTVLVLGEVKMVDGSHGDWKTDFASLRKQRDDRNFIMVNSCTQVIFIYS